MSEAKHTPGPWHYEAGGGHANNRIRGSDIIQVHGWPERINGVSNASYSDCVCENLGDTSLPGPAANARLIAAAPDLLAALEELASDIEDRFDMASSSTNPGMKSAVSRARAAIAKAKGGAE